MQFARISVSSFLSYTPSQFFSMSARTTLILNYDILESSRLVVPINACTLFMNFPSPGKPSKSHTRELHINVSEGPHRAANKYLSVDDQPYKIGNRDREYIDVCEVFLYHCLRIYRLN